MFGSQFDAKLSSGKGPFGTRNYLIALQGIPLVAITTHINADGDAAGSVAAMARLLPQMGHKGVIVNPTPWPGLFAFLKDGLDDRSAGGARAGHLAVGSGQPESFVRAGPALEHDPGRHPDHNHSHRHRFLHLPALLPAGGGSHRGQGLSPLLRVEEGKVVIDTGRCRAVIFDMDGVITDSVPVHRRAWKETFDSILDEIGSGAPPFDELTDYLTHVDGKPRYDGVRDFLASRGIDLPEGTPDDAADQQTVSGVGNRKNEMFLEALAEGGVDPFRSTLALIDQLRTAGVAVALITSSRNAAAVLASADVDPAIFEALVDGNESARLALPGKPDPAIFLEAASRLGVEPATAVVVEDAVSGVEAGRAGGFGGVIGIDRGDNRKGLEEAGADVVVEDLGEVVVGSLTR